MMKKAILSLLLTVFTLSAFSISIKRELSKSTIKKNEIIDVTLTIVRDNIVGVTKLIEFIPDGFDAMVINKSAGRANFDGGELKIQWLSLPANEEIIIEYRLIHLGLVEGTSEITGVFTYLENNSQQAYQIESTKIYVGNNAIVSAKKEVKTNTVNTKEKIVPVKKEVKATVPEVVVVKNKEKIETKPKVDDVVVTSKVNNMTYKVQVGAFRIEKSLSFFEGLPNVSFKKVGDLYKYYTGAFENEEDARGMIAQAESQGYEGAFLVVEKRK